MKVQATIRVGRPKRHLESPADTGHALLLDPKQIVLSRWANRHDESYLNAAFLELKKSVQHDGGNQVPVLVRPLGRGVDPATARYELVYGHRRLRACQELGVPVRAVIEKLSDIELVARMHAENRDRETLSAYEAGAFYKRLLDTGMYASQRRLAEALGIDHSDASRKIWLASLPAELIQIFESPLEISCDDVKRMQPAWNRDSVAMQRRAQAMYELDGPLPPKKAIARLMAGPEDVSVGGSDTPDVEAAPATRREVVEIQSSDATGVTFRVNTRLPDEKREELKRQIAALVQQLSIPAEAPPVT